MGEIDLATALKYSRNVAAARLAQKIGLESIIKLARRAGIEEELPPHPSLALGSVEMSPLQMASAYTIFPNDGIGVEAVAVKQVVDGTGEAVESHHFANKRDVLSSKTAQSMVGMMKAVVEQGTGTKAKLKNHEAAGKTGTTDSFRDAWFVGYTADYTAAVWVGNDDNSQMEKKSYGGDMPARIWKEVMEAALEGKEPTKFFLDRLTEPGRERTDGGSSTGSEDDPESEVVIDSSPKVILTVCKETRLRAQPGCPAIVKVDVESAADVDWCTRHSETTPEPTEWVDRQPADARTVYQDQNPSATYSNSNSYNSNNTGHSNSNSSGQYPQNPTYQEDPPPAYEQPTQTHTWEQRRHEGSVNNVRSMDGMDSVQPINGRRRGSRGGSLDDEGGL